MFVYAAKSCSQEMSDAKGTIPNAEFVGADREKKVRCTRWAKRKLSVFVVASGSSNTQLEGCSMWFFSLIDIVVCPEMFSAREIGCQRHDPKCRLMLLATARTTFIRASWQMAN